MQFKYTVMIVVLTLIMSFLVTYMAGTFDYIAVPEQLNSTPAEIFSEGQLDEDDKKQEKKETATLYTSLS